jgi:hypothetical protein
VESRAEETLNSRKRNAAVTDASGSDSRQKEKAMSNDTLMNHAVEFCRHNDLMLTPEGEALLRPGLTAKEYFRLLMANNEVLDANRVLAHAMPKRHALWWGLLCVWDSLQPKAPENVAEVLSSVARFVAEPGEQQRRTVEELAGLVRADSSSYCLAMGAFLSGGSMSLPHLPTVLPKPFLTGRLVGVAVYLASVAHWPHKYKERLRNYLTLGLEVVRTPNPWSQPVAVPVPVQPGSPIETPIPWDLFAGAST